MAVGCILLPMGTRMWVLGLLLAVAFACGLDRKRAGHGDDADPGFSAESLELSNHDSILNLLEPEEREAFTRSKMSGLDNPGGGSLDSDSGDQTESTGKKADEAAKVGLSVLTVAITVGAAVAPFFLF
jgi:hypothetical protein